MARRSSGRHLAGYWEFPGGKVDDGESAEDCLARELAEEFGVDAVVGTFYTESVFDYGDKIVRLLAYEVESFEEPQFLKDHDLVDWLLPSELVELQLAPADVPIAEKLARAFENKRA